MTYADRSEHGNARGAEYVLTIRPGCSARLSSGRTLRPGDVVDPEDPEFSKIAHKCHYVRAATLSAVKAVAAENLESLEQSRKPKTKGKPKE